jgi:2-isopropylmalate synthase
MTRGSVAYAKKYVSDVEFSPMDASRSDRAFLYQVLQAAIEEGATTINIPDTVGYAYPEEFADLIREIRNNVPNIDKAVLSVHCHNDLGMATANTLSAIEAGARQAEVTVNGIGERAGNTSLEEVVMALHTRKDFYSGLIPRIDTKQIVPTSKLVSHLTGIVVQPNKAIVGANAFAHEAGIHQDGMLKNRDTYEIMTPQSVGLEMSRLVLGKHSGRAGFTARLNELGFDGIPKEKINELYQRFIELSDRKKTVTNADIIAIIEEDAQPKDDLFVLSGWRANSGNDGRAEAWVKVLVDGIDREATAKGNGQIDALFKAIDKLIPGGCALESFHIDAVTPGEDAQGEVSVRVRCGEHVYNGRGVATDIVEASVRAYMKALNRGTVVAEVTA